jgi:hypothetical protein
MPDLMMMDFRRALLVLLEGLELSSKSTLRRRQKKIALEED